MQTRNSKDMQSGMAGTIISAFRDNWAIIVQAPLAFATLAMILTGVIWFALSYLKGNQTESLNARLKLRNDEIANYKRNLEGASPDAAARRIAAVEQAVAELRPKRYTDEQLDRLVAELAAHNGKVSIIVEMSYTDGQLLSAQLQATFARAGWQVSNGMFGGPPMRPRQNLMVSVSGAERTVMEQTVISALSTAEIPFALGPRGSAEQVAIRIIQSFP